MLRPGFGVLLGIVLLVAPATYATSPTTAGEYILEGYESPHPYQSSGQTSADVDLG
jgi:hypothetical protein